jgi:hypothetical protein
VRERAVLVAVGPDFSRSKTSILTSEAMYWQAGSAEAITVWMGFLKERNIDRSPWSCAASE